MLSKSAEDCLKQVYKLQAEEVELVSTNALAARLEVAPASVTSMIKRLAAMGLLEHRPYGGVRLTTRGEKVAVEVIRHHRLIETYLSDKLGMSWDEVHEEAEVLEHVLSERLERHFDEALGHPDRDPHGDPIPTAAGELETDTFSPLSDLEPGKEARVARVPDSRAEVLRYLGGMGIHPLAWVKVLAAEPFEGPLTVEIAGRQRVLAHDLAQQIYVARTTG